MNHPSSLSRQIPQSPALRTLALSASSRLSSNGRVSEAKIRNPLRDWHCHVMSSIQTLPQETDLGSVIGGEMADVPQECQTLAGEVAALEATNQKLRAELTTLVGADGVDRLGPTRPDTPAAA